MKELFEKHFAEILGAAQQKYADYLQSWYYMKKITKLSHIIGRLI